MPGSLVDGSILSLFAYFTWTFELCGAHLYVSLAPSSVLE